MIYQQGGVEKIRADETYAAVLQCCSGNWIRLASHHAPVTQNVHFPGEFHYQILIVSPAFMYFYFSAVHKKKSFNLITLFEQMFPSFKMHADGIDLNRRMPGWHGIPAKKTIRMQIHQITHGYILAGIMKTLLK